MSERLVWAALIAGVAIVLGGAGGMTLWSATHPEPPPAPPAPPPPPPQWECGVAYGNEICERGLPPARPAP